LIQKDRFDKLCSTKKIQTAGYSHRKLAAQTNTSIQGQEELAKRTCNFVKALVPRKPNYEEEDYYLNKHQYISPRLLLQLLLFTTH